MQMIIHSFELSFNVSSVGKSVISKVGTTLGGALSKSLSILGTALGISVGFWDGTIVGSMLGTGSIGGSTVVSIVGSGDGTSIITFFQGLSGFESVGSQPLYGESVGILGAIGFPSGPGVELA